MSLLKKPPGFSNSVSAISMSVAALVLPMVRPMVLRCSTDCHR
jgi:hypothetical protein